MRWKTAAVVIALTATSTVRAGWIEVGDDAGQFPGTAQMTIGVGELRSILGSLTETDDIDMYRIKVSDPALFSATTKSDKTSLFDTQLFLFDAIGFGLLTNDDIDPPSGEANARIPFLPDSVQAGDELLIAVAEFFEYPTSDLLDPKRIFPETSLLIDSDLPSPKEVLGPTGAGGTQPVSAWQLDGANAPFGGRDYEIVLEGAEFAVVPEPSSLLLAALGILGCAFHHRRHGFEEVAVTRQGRAGR